MFPRRWSRFILPLCSVPFLYSQTAPAPDIGFSSTSPTFKAKVRAVLVDVVVTDRNGAPIVGLPQKDFEVLEDGKPQVISSFEEHRPGPSGPMPQRPSLPPNTYTNAPVVPPTSAINVLLVDSLNTEIADQATVRLQLIKYLKTVEPGPRLAVFALGERLRMIEGFTTDPQKLLLAINHKGWGGNPQPSHMTQTAEEDAAQSTALNQMADVSDASGQDLSGLMESLQSFLTEVQNTQKETRMATTLNVLQSLAGYLSAYPGRKNLIWFSGSFPEIDFPSSRQLMQLDAAQSGLDTAIKKTISVLATAQVAVYPVGAEGLQTQALYQASTPTAQAKAAGTGMSSAQKMIVGQNQELQKESVSRFYNQDAADNLAKNTGGKSFFNTNGLKEALAEAVHEGSYYYRLFYSPTDKRMLGRYRNIEVKVKGHHTLAYRRGYFEETEKEAKALQAQPADPLHPLMARGLPDSTQIVYKVHVIPSTAQPAANAPRAGDNSVLHGPLTRYRVDFIVPVDSLQFETGADDVRHGSMELGVLVYDHDGRPLNWTLRSFKTSLKPSVYQAIKSTGANFHLDIDVPAGDLYMRTGIYDLESNNAGTMEIPMSAIAKAAIFAATAPTQLGPAGSPADANAAPDYWRKEMSKLATANPDTASSIAKFLNSSDWNPQGFASSMERFELKQTDLEPANIADYCAELAATGQHASALAKVCEYAFGLRKKLPNVICDREVKRRWADLELSPAGHDRMVIFAKHSDVVTVEVTYREGHENYSNIRIDGSPVSPATPWTSGAWSVGDFGLLLEDIFVPLSKPEFKFEREDRSGLVFSFHITAANNKLYFLHFGNELWYPEYKGEILVDKSNFRLLRLSRETSYSQYSPIRQTKTEIDYRNIPLGDGSSLVLPTHSEVRVCSAPILGSRDNCSLNLVKFTNWHKFRATTKILTSSAN